MHGCATGFTAAARKEGPDDTPPQVDGSHLQDGWRERVRTELGVLARAWRDPAA